MMTLDADFSRLLSSQSPRVVYYVDVGGLAGGQFVLASRPLKLGAGGTWLHPSVLDVPVLPSRLDPKKGKQTLEKITVTFLDDGGVRDLITGGTKLIGKTLTVKVGIDPGEGNDANFALSQFAPYGVGLISRIRLTAAQTIEVTADDFRSVGMGSRTLGALGLPDPSVNPGGIPAYSVVGCATDVMQRVMTDAGIPTANINTATFSHSAAANDGVSHFVVERMRYPGDTNIGAVSDRRVIEAEPVFDLVDQI